MIGIGEYYYDEQMLGGIREPGNRLFFSASKVAENEKITLERIRYSIEYYLGWNPETAVMELSEEVLTRLGLREEAKTRIAYPPEAKDDPAAENEYLLSLLYPQQRAYRRAYFTKHCYEKGLETGRLPENMFDDSAAGGGRAGLCLLYALKKDGYQTPEQMYRLLGGCSAGRWLKEKKLKHYCDLHYAAPPDFLRAVLPGESEPFYREAKERIRKRREAACRRYGTLGFLEEKRKDE